MREREIEKYLVKEVKKQKGLCLKFVCPGMDGVPDRIVLLPSGGITFVEVKAPGKKPRALQLRRMKQLEQLGFKCFVVDSKETVLILLDEIGGDAL